MADGAGHSIHAACGIPMSSLLPPGKSTRSKSTALIIRCSGLIVLPDGATRPRKASCSQSRAAGLSPTSNSCATSKPPSPTFLPRVSCVSKRKSALSCGNSHRDFDSIARGLSIFARCCRETPKRRLPWRKGTTTASAVVLGREPSASADCGTPSRFAIRVSWTPLSSRFCASRGWRWFFADSVSWPYAEDITADFVYLRLHGSEELYASGYSDEALDHWAARIKQWARGLEPKDARLIAPHMKPERCGARNVFVYFDNDSKVRAPVDARSLRAKLH
jgi:uncharacterized protein DUF72